MQVKRLTLLRRHTPFLWGDATPTYAVLHGHTIGLHPATDLLEAIDSRSGKDTRSLRADVQQEVSIAPSRLDEQADEGRIGLVVLVNDLLAPQTIHRLTSLNRQFTNCLT